MHPNHQKETSKLNRAAGQIEGIKRMIDEQVYCIDIITQIRAARSALKSVELSILETHMKSCLIKITDDKSTSKGIESDANIEKEKQLAEIITMLKKYE